MSAASSAKPRTKPAVTRRRKTYRWFKALFLSAAIGAFFGMVGYLAIILNGYRLLAANLDKLNLSEATIVYDAEGREIAKLYGAEGNREIVSLNEIPELLRKTVIAVEDRRFYEHQGVDYWAIGRALYRDIVSRSLAEGGSTITQQVAKNIFIADPKKTFFRKATEASIALALERTKTKDEILELYFNRIYFGESAYGIEAASKLYFGKSVKSGELTVAEIAMLAGLPKNPNGYSPFRNPERAKERRAVVLSIMAEQGLITEEEKNRAMNEPFRLNDRVPAVQHPAYVDYAVDEVERLAGISEEELFRGGYRIYTALDPKVQNAVERVFANDALFPKKAASQTDSPESAMVVVRPSDGRIVAMVGGREYARKGLNRATVRRQPGSAFKPIAVYGPAIESGKWTPDSILEDVKRCFDDYCPENYNGKYLGNVTMRQALRDSINVPAVWLLDNLVRDAGGFGPVFRFIRNLGIELDEKNDRHLAIALGGLTSGVTPLEMAQAYGVFANQGVLVPAHAVLRVEDSRGRTVYTAAAKPKQVIRPSTAYWLTVMLQEAVVSGTGKKARMDRPVAGKTGTTQEPGKKGANRDIWFVGYTPQYAAAVWIGFDRPDALHSLTADSGQAAAVFSAAMRLALEGVPKGEFKRPPGVEEPSPSPSPSSSPTPSPTPSADNGAGGITLTAAYDAVRHAVRLMWTPSEQAALYRIFREGGSENGKPSPIAETSDVRWLDADVEDGAEYRYYVAALAEDGQTELGRSNPTSVRIPAGGRLPSPSASPKRTPAPPTASVGEGEPSATPPEENAAASPPALLPSVPAVSNKDGGT
ncbi:MAG: hypothetical protein BLM47_00360 [Candidatus Reconcilbacillus cellulovorans]|uniref:Uncharacterized protein n=1 Tax=Candidatus Reconcilbacillus cellulovorans TaxID=1906605 RepID=A0A2A6E4C9_9BACL|nr:MAG: hypothetical protein BLM47_00360 [Candidatus Reconcilbacillus cellulovorans]